MSQHPVDPLETTATELARPRPAPGSESLIGKTLAHFRIDARLGAGGMGEVFKATDLALDRPVAVKILPRKIAESPELRERFYREARAQARIQHPNVGHIYFIGEQDDLLFFAMEYIDGETLAEQLERGGKLAPTEALEYVRQAAMGLREANRHGFTHRDIKPSNLMVDRNGTVKVLDFGIVKQADPQQAKLTSTGGEGQLIGTPLYMAPEQARGETIDFRTDIYALGATLHHLIAGAPPYAGDTAMAVVSKHLSEPRSRVPGRKYAEADRVCARMMAKRPRDRFADYGDLIAATERASPAYSHHAGFWVRLLALVFDFVGVVLITQGVSMLVPLDEDALFAVIAPLYYVGFLGWRGQTPGKSMLDIRVVSVDRAGPVGYARAALRFADQWGPTYALVIGGILIGDISETMQVIAIAMAITAFVLPLVSGALVRFDPARRARWDRRADTRVEYATRPG